MKPKKQPNNAIKPKAPKQYDDYDDGAEDAEYELYKLEQEAKALHYRLQNNLNY